MTATLHGGVRPQGARLQGPLVQRPLRSGLAIWLAAGALAPAGAWTVALNGASWLAVPGGAAAGFVIGGLLIAGLRRERPRQAQVAAAALSGVVLALLLPAGTSPAAALLVAALVAVAVRGAFGLYGQAWLNPALLASALLMLLVAAPSRHDSGAAAESLVASSPATGGALIIIRQQPTVALTASRRAALTATLRRVLPGLETLAQLRGPVSDAVAASLRRPTAEPGVAMLVMLAGLLLAAAGVIKWRAGAAFLLVASAGLAVQALFAAPGPQWAGAIGAAGGRAGLILADWWGALALGAWFLAADAETSPITSSGQAVGGALGGGCLLLLTTPSAATAATVAVLIVNVLTPLLDVVTRRHGRGTGLVARLRAIRGAVVGAALSADGR